MSNFDRDRPKEYKNYKDSVSNRFSNYKKRAKKKQIKLKLTKKQFEEITSKPCHYCGGFSRNNFVGLDRVDLHSNYDLDNVLPSCSMCNYMRWIYEQEVFLRHVKKIYEYMSLSSNG